MLKAGAQAAYGFASLSHRRRPIACHQLPAFDVDGAANFARRDAAGLSRGLSDYEQDFRKDDDAGYMHIYIAGITAIAS